METGNPICAEVTMKPQTVVLRDTVRRQQVPNVIIRQPTASEVFGLTFESRGDTNDQELSNEFARLLNRGSSLE